MFAKWHLLFVCTIFSILACLESPFESHAQDVETKSFTTCDGKLSFDYPAEWFIQESQVAFPNFALMDGTVENLPVVRFYYPQEDFLGQNWSTPGYLDVNLTLQIPWALGDDRPSPFDQFSSVAMETVGNTRTYDAPVEVTVQNWLAARRDYVRTNGDLQIAGFDMIIAISDKYDLYLSAEADANQITTLEATLQIFLDSLVYTETSPNTIAEGWLLYFKDSCDFHFSYPQDWIISEAASNKILLFNSQEVADKRIRRRALAEHELEIVIIQPTELADYLYGNLDPNQATPEEILSAYIQIEQLPAEFPVSVTVGDSKTLWADLPDGFVLLYDFGDGQYAIFAAHSGNGGFSEFEDTVLQIAASLQFEQEAETVDLPTQRP